MGQIGRKMANGRLLFQALYEDDDKPILPNAPPPLPGVYAHADKDTIPLSSH